jgi:hypothetical protein
VFRVDYQSGLEGGSSICTAGCTVERTGKTLLPTHHDYAVSTLEYQLDQSSPLAASAAPDSVLEIQKQKPPNRFADIDRSLHITSGVEVIGSEFERAGTLQRVALIVQWLNRRFCVN